MTEAVGALVRFHTTHKLLLLAHSPEKYRELGRIVASARSDNVAHLTLCYAVQFVSAMQTAPTRGRHVNVLQHVAGYLRDRLDADARRELARAIASYQGGAAPLDLPVRLIAAHARRHQVSYLCDQVYVQRYAMEPAVEPPPISSHGCG